MGGAFLFSKIVNLRALHWWSKLLGVIIYLSFIVENLFLSNLKASERMRELVACTSRCIKAGSVSVNRSKVVVAYLICILRLCRMSRCARLFLSATWSFFP